MAKALVGHLGGPDPRTMVEMRRLHEQVRTLTAEIERLRAENDTLAASLTEAHFISLEAAQEPALA